MKEADIVFGDLYAVEIENRIHCKRIPRKVPPESGRQRSRTYVLDEPSSPGATSNYPDTIDASKIIMSWRDYEKTADYAEKHLDELQTSLDGEVRTAINKWWQTLSQYLESLAGASIASYIPYTVASAQSIPELEELVRDYHCSVNVGRLMDLGKIPMPPLDDVEGAINMREEVLREAGKALLPKTAEKLTTSFEKDASGVVIEDWDYSVLDNYLGLLRRTEEPGPHEPLVALAKSNPHYQPLKDLTQEPQFQYLIHHLNFS